MRRLLTGLVVAGITAVVPTLALADNQDTADQIAKNLRDSGQLHGYKIGVKVQDGTAWLKGQVQSQAQMNTALRLVFQTSGVTRIVNDLKVTSAEEAAKPTKAARKQAQTARLATSTTLRIGEDVAAPTASRRAMASRKLGGAHEVEFASHEADSQPRRRVLVQPATALEPLAIPRQTISMSRQATVPGRPIPVAYTQPTAAAPGRPIPAYVSGAGGGVAPARYDQPHMPNYAWPSYASYPNYAGLTYPRQYSPTAWPFIGPFYPYPQVPLGWRKVTLEWDDGWWMLDFKDR